MKRATSSEDVPSFPEYLVVTTERKGPLKDLCAEGKIILKRFLRKSVDGTLTNLRQERDKWRAVVTEVMELPVPQNEGNFVDG
jgi:hypothetical protein